MVLNIKLSTNNFILQCSISYSDMGMNPIVFLLCFFIYTLCFFYGIFGNYCSCPCYPMSWGFSVVFSMLSHVLGGFLSYFLCYPMSWGFLSYFVVDSKCFLVN